jgi:hypothetical protein
MLMSLFRIIPFDEADNIEAAKAILISKYK